MRGAALHRINNEVPPKKKPLEGGYKFKSLMIIKRSSIRALTAAGKPAKPKIVIAYEEDI